VISLFFKDLSKIDLIKNLIDIYKILYGIIGCGSRHSPHAIFKLHTKELNDGVTSGLVRAADTRMAGYFIAFIRLLRLYPAVVSTLQSLEFKKYCQENRMKRTKMKVIEIVITKDFHQAVNSIVVPLKPALKLLRMADTNTPAMDMLYYLALQTRTYLKKFRNPLNRSDLLSKIPIIGDFVPRPGTSSESSSANSSSSSSSPALTDVELDDVLEDEPLPLLTGIIPDKVDVPEEIEEEDGNSDSDSASDLDVDNESEEMGDLISLAWQDRMKKLVHPYSLTAFLCSTDPNVNKMVKRMKDDCELGSMQLKVDGLIAKLVNNKDEEFVAAYQTKFWAQWEDFIERRGKYYSRNRIWMASTLSTTRSHEWHKDNSLQQAPEFGSIACITTSKYLGIGMAERQWADVKSTKSGQRSHLGSDATEKQSVIFGAACMENARFAYESSPTTWTNEPADFEEAMATMTLAHDDTERLPPVRVFNAWLEGWETPLIAKKDPENERKILRKYQGLHFLNPYSASSSNGLWKILDQLEYRKQNQRCGAYVIMAIRIDDDGEEMDEGPDNIDVWEFVPDLYEQIMATTQPKILRVRVVNPPMFNI
jgi:hypothetical protein